VAIFREAIRAVQATLDDVEQIHRLVQTEQRAQ
jgi:hypothetical protein